MNIFLRSIISSSSEIKWRKANPSLSRRWTILLAIKRTELNCPVLQFFGFRRFRRDFGWTAVNAVVRILTSTRLRAEIFNRENSVTTRFERFLQSRRTFSASVSMQSDASGSRILWLIRSEASSRSKWRKYTVPDMYMTQSRRMNGKPSDFFC